MKKILNAFTVDVEDYFQVTAFEQQVRRRDWGDYESRVVGSTKRMLKLLNDCQVPATFFVLGWVAERFPQLVRDIHRAGHEVGSHSYWHRMIYDLTAEQFREDLLHSRDVLEQIIGESVTAYRAPSFSITSTTLWALDILAAEGFTSDSSIYPIYHDRYGIPKAKPFLHQVTTDYGELWEFPASVVRLSGMNVPVSGGGYFRLYPLPFSVHALASINRRQSRPFMFYTHPWEIDPNQPRLSAGSWMSRRRHCLGLHSTERKLRGLLSRFRFGRLRDVIAQSVPPVPATSLVQAG